MTQNNPDPSEQVQGSTNLDMTLYDSSSVSHLGMLMTLVPTSEMEESSTCTWDAGTAQTQGATEL